MPVNWYVSLSCHQSSEKPRTWPHKSYTRYCCDFCYGFFVGCYWIRSICHIFYHCFTDPWAIHQWHECNQEGMSEDDLCRTITKQNHKQGAVRMHVIWRIIYKYNIYRIFIRPVKQCQLILIHKHGPQVAPHSNHGPLVRYVNLRVAHSLGMPETFFPPLRVGDPVMHHGTCVTHVPWCMPGSLSSSFLWSRWQWKAFHIFPAHAQPTILRIW